MTPTTGIQLLLRLASIDPGFLVILRRDPQAAAASAEIALTRSEQAILATLSADDLERMVTRLPLPAPERRDFLRQVAVGALGVLGVGVGLTAAGCERRPAELACPQPPPRSQAQPRAQPCERPAKAQRGLYGLRGPMVMPDPHLAKRLAEERACDDGVIELLEDHLEQQRKKKSRTKEK